MLDAVARPRASGFAPNLAALASSQERHGGSDGEQKTRSAADADRAYVSKNGAIVHHGRTDLRNDADLFGTI